MINRTINSQQLSALCDVLANTSEGLTESEIRKKLTQCNIKIQEKGNKATKYQYTIGLNKRDWLYNCFVQEINQNQSYRKIYSFIENSLDPVNYTTDTNRNKYIYLFNETNKILLLLGLQIQENGKISLAKKAETLSDIDKRFKSLNQKLNDRNIHEQVKKYCIKEYLDKDYSIAVFEASKGIAERVRKITGIEEDGSKLFQKAFSTKDPYLYFNYLKSKTEISEFTGLKELLESIFHLVRNPVAHTPKINWQIEEDKALDILTLISFAHKYLDECKAIPHLK